MPINVMTRDYRLNQQYFTQSGSDVAFEEDHHNNVHLLPCATSRLIKKKKNMLGGITMVQ